MDKEIGLDQRFFLFSREKPITKLSQAYIREIAEWHVAEGSAIYPKFFY